MRTIVNYCASPFTGYQTRLLQRKPTAFTSKQLAGPSADEFRPSVHFSAKRPHKQLAQLELTEYVIKLELPKKADHIAAHREFEAKLGTWLEAQGLQEQMMVNIDPLHPKGTTISTTSAFLQKYLGDIMETFPEIKAVSLDTSNPPEDADTQPQKNTYH